MKNNYLITAILVIVFAGAGFYGGMKYQQSQRGNFSGQFGNEQIPMRNGRQGNTGVNGRGGFRPVAGEIISADDKSITVKLQDESSKLVLINSKTVVNKAQVVDKTELKVGEKVSVFGSENTDGSVTAQNVQLGPVGATGIK
ncbi:MAG: DUF5666 domain-containing protein [Patescibacteria group bacterium]|jgi:hypothetical protein